MSDSKSQMDDKTKAALEASITKWKQHAVATVPPRSIGAEECPLCELFFWGDTRCQGCPVRVETGHPSCRNTPYVEAHNMRWEWECGISSREKFHEAAAKEVAFLESLGE